MGPFLLNFFPPDGAAALVGGLFFPGWALSVGRLRRGSLERRGCWSGYERRELRGGKRLRRLSEEKAGSAEGLQGAGGVLCQGL